jgi:hypothetical protein
VTSTCSSAALSRSSSRLSVSLSGEGANRLVQNHEASRVEVSSLGEGRLLLHRASGL